MSKSDLVFKVDSALGEKQALASPLIQALRETRPAPELRSGPNLKTVLNEIGSSANPKRATEGKKSGHRPQLWYRVSRAEEAAGLARLDPDRVILPLTTPTSNESWDCIGGWGR